MEKKNNLDFQIWDNFKNTHILQKVSTGKDKQSLS